MYYLDNMTEKGDKADEIISYLLDQGIIDHPEKSELTISGKGILIYKILGHIIEKDEVDID